MDELMLTCGGCGNTLMVPIPDILAEEVEEVVAVGRCGNCDAVNHYIFVPKMIHHCVTLAGEIRPTLLYDCQD